MLQDHENQPLSEPGQGALVSSSEASERPAEPPFRWFSNPRIAAFWRFVLFLILLRILLIPLLFSAVRPFRFRFESSLDYISEALVVIAVLLSTLIMARLDRRSFFDYGLRDVRAGANLLKGMFVGFGSLTLMLLALSLGHYSHFGRQFMHGSALIYAAALNAFEFALTAIYEEMAFRGYGLCALAEGVGFWPAAVAMSAYFAWEHTFNQGESRVGIAAVFAFGMVLAFSLRRTGSLLWAMGFHFMWDYSETFVYGVPDSGLVSPAHLLSVRFTGPEWITGGSVGPEGSYFVFVVLAAVVLMIHLVYPSRRFQKT